MSQENKGFEGERRKYIRFACSTELQTIIDFNPDAARRALGTFPPIEFHKGEKATVKNISEKGISIELERLLPVGITIKMAINSPITPPIKTGARVVWCKKSAGSRERYILGMTYRYMQEKHRRNLEKLIEFLQTIPD